MPNEKLEGHNGPGTVSKDRRRLLRRDVFDEMCSIICVGLQSLIVVLGSREITARETSALGYVNYVINPASPDNGSN